MTWDALVAAAGLEAHTAGYALSLTEAARTWVDVVRDLTRVADRADTVVVATLISEYAASLHTTYFLTVVNGRMEVIHGLRPCFHVPGGGIRVLGLMKDRIRRGTGLEIPPKLYSLTGQPGAQGTEGFHRVTAMAPELLAVQATFAANAALHVVPALPILDPLHPPVETRAFKTMPLHPKLACLFLPGMPIRAGVNLILALQAAVPVALRPGMDELVAFGRVAATETAVGGVSVLTSSWRVIDHAQSPDVEEWYYALVEREVPRVPVPPPAVAPPAAAPPTTGVTFTAGTTGGIPPDPAHAMVALVESLLVATNRDREPAGGKPYPRHDLEKLFGVTGVGQPWTGLGEQFLPLTYAEIKPYRSKAATARNFLESSFRKRYPVDREIYPFNWSTELVRSVRELDFTGRDDMCNWADREKGLSIFSLAPADEFGDGVAARELMLAYESTIAHHTPADARQMAELQATVATFPSARIPVRSWVDHTTIGLTFLLGETFIALPALGDILRHLRQPSKFIGYSGLSFRALVWQIHRGLRCCFATNATGPLEHVAYLLEMNQPIPTANLPAELHGPAAIISDASSAGSIGTDMSSLSGGGGAEYSRVSDYSRQSGAPPGKRPKAAAPDCVAMFAADIARARQGLGHNRFYVSNLAKGQRAINSLFGDEFLALLPAGQRNPCLRHFITGDCNNPSCSNCHHLVRKPSPDVFKGIQGRVKLACDHLIKHPPKA